MRVPPTGLTPVSVPPAGPEPGRAQRGTRSSPRRGVFRSAQTGPPRTQSRRAPTTPRTAGAACAGICLFIGHPGSDQPTRLQEFLQRSTRCARPRGSVVRPAAGWKGGVNHATARGVAAGDRLPAEWGSRRSARRKRAAFAQAVGASYARPTVRRVAGATTSHAKTQTARKHADAARGVIPAESATPPQSIVILVDVQASRRDGEGHVVPAPIPRPRVSTASLCRPVFAPAWVSSWRRLRRLSVALVQAPASGSRAGEDNSAQRPM